MADYPTDQKAKFGTLLTISAATFTGGYQSLGAPNHVPVIMFIQNDTTVSVTLSDDGINAGKVFISGERAVLDFRANNGDSNAFSFPINTPFFVMGTAGTGNFQISYLYAQ